MIIFIDFDDVLFNTKKFRSDLRGAFLKNGIALNIFRKYYYDYPIAKSNGQLLKYDFGEHVKRIKELGIDTANLEKDAEKLIGSTRKYVFSDSLFFLRQFKKNLYIVSYAKTKFQVLKIKNSGLERYFNGVFIFDEMKGEAVRKVLGKNKPDNKEKIYFIDDRVEQIENVKKKFPEATSIFVKRKEGRYNDRRSKYCDFQVKNLREALKIIN